MAAEDLPVLAFETGAALRAWLLENHASSPGVWVRIYKQASGVASVTFDEVLDEGLCFGWSESQRVGGDERSYLQRFTPRCVRGTVSKRNRKRFERLLQEKRMTPFGLVALGIEPDARGRRAP